MNVTGSSSWDRNVGDFFSDALGNVFLWNQLGHLSNFLPNLQNWHKSILLINVFGISSVHVTRYLLPPNQVLLVNIAQERGNLVDYHLLHSPTIELQDFLLVVTFACDDPTRLVLHGTSDVDRTLLLLELLHFFLKIHRLHLNALDRCEWLRASRNFSCSGSKPFPHLRATRHLVKGRGSLCTRWTFWLGDGRLVGQGLHHQSYHTLTHTTQHQRIFCFVFAFVVRDDLARLLILPSWRWSGCAALNGCCTGHWISQLVVFHLERERFNATTRSGQALVRVFGSM